MSKQLQIKNKTYTEDPNLDILADKVIHDKNMMMIGTIPVEIKYILVYPSISKTVAGKCIRTSNETRFMTGKHYIVEFSGELWDQLDEETQELLMYHELLHIDIDTNKQGEYVYKLRDHNVKDFIEIISEHGVEWLENFRTKFASVYDLEPKDTAKINL